MSANKVIPLNPAVRSRIVRPSGRSLNQDALKKLIGYKLRRAEILLRQHFIKTLSDWGLRPAEYSALVLIATNSDVTPGDLGQALDIKRPNMVTLIARLEHQGLIQRAVHHQDRRSQILTLTPKGEAMLADVEPLIHESDFDMTSCWTREQREQFMLLTEILIDR